MHVIENKIISGDLENGERKISLNYRILEIKYVGVQG